MSFTFQGHHSRELANPFRSAFSVLRTAPLCARLCLCPSNSPLPPPRVYLPCIYPRLACPGIQRFWDVIGLSIHPKSTRSSGLRARRQTRRAESELLLASSLRGLQLLVGLGFIARRGATHLRFIRFGGGDARPPNRLLYRPTGTSSIRPRPARGQLQGPTTTPCGARPQAGHAPQLELGMEVENEMELKIDTAHSHISVEMSMSLEMEMKKRGYACSGAVAAAPACTCRWVLRMRMETEVQRVWTYVLPTPALSSPSAPSSSSSSEAGFGFSFKALRYCMRTRAGARARDVDVGVVLPRLARGIRLTDAEKRMRTCRPAGYDSVRTSVEVGMKIPMFALPPASAPSSASCTTVPFPGILIYILPRLRLRSIHVCDHRA
ncbi:hypothetical protein B0H13DRAFT_2359219 [Mycena leptocephala]|nr:hypothetical protein B0H13DRAFT_2359219 [Mycena leptocephala]